MKKYRIIQNEQNKQAIFDTETGQQISQWWQYIYIKTQNPEYYIALNDENKEAIFHIDNPNQPISQWWRVIHADNMLKGQSEYYVARNQHGKYALFHINNPYEPISQWWLWIEQYRLSGIYPEYYVAQHSNGNKAIFHINNPYEPVSQWWVQFSPSGLLIGQSEYYIAHNYNKQCAIFHIDDPYEPISDWHHHIYPLGLITNTSELYATISSSDHNSPIQIYHYDNIQQPLYKIYTKNKNFLLYFTDTFALYLTDQYIIKHDATNNKVDYFKLLPQHIQIFLYQEYRNKPLDHISHSITNQLIYQYIDYNFIPVIFNYIDDTMCHIFTKDGNYINSFMNIKDAKKYMQQEIAKKDISYDFIRLY